MLPFCFRKHRGYPFGAQADFPQLPFRASEAQGTVPQLPLREADGTVPVLPHASLLTPHSSLSPAFLFDSVIEEVFAEIIPEKRSFTLDADPRPGIDFDDFKAVPGYDNIVT